MRSEAKISTTGQITLPDEIRDALGVTAGDTLIFESDAGGVRLLRRADADPFAAVSGALRVGDGLTIAEINARVRAWRDGEE
ncbi:MAG: AbrB/MazE/SpoVT family DNA-binding domain-containing protein [Thermomicrobiales bacterium]